MRHIGEDALTEYVLNGGGAAESAAIEAHLKDCGACHTRFLSTTAFLDALQSGDTWEAVETGSSSFGREREVLELAARSEREYVEAQAALGPLLADMVAFTCARIELREEYRTAGVVRVLSEAANAACERNPLHARNLSDAAVAVAEQLSPTDYPRDTVRTMRGLAWKERANALRFLAEYQGALDALDHAEREFSRLGAHTLELGNLAYIRAVVLTYMDRLDEATRQAAQSAEISAAYGDTDRWIRARSVEAGVLFYRCEFAKAARVFEQLRAYAESKGDALGLARHSFRMATCLIELGDAPRATSLLLDARRTFKERDVRTEIVRIDWKLGVLARVTGRVEESIAQLRSSRKTCDEMGMADEATNVTLDLIESLLVAGQTHEIAPLCSKVMHYFRRSGKLRQAMTAVAFLKEAAAQGRIRVETVQHVRTFVQRLERLPDLLFAPPAD